ncbi:MAG TPA: hypothetical protein VKF82_02160 [Candidatus Eremiobacteraceae bacterium]|nr:hypothetical protein [Candidatus Eremiobacteraceae bacterium]
MKTRIILLAAILTLAPIAAAAIPHAPAPVDAQTKDMLLPQGTFVRVRILNQMSSQYSHAGDPFSWVVSDDILVGKRVVIPAGTIGFGRLSKVIPAHGGNQPGYMVLTFYPIALTDGGRVDVAITKASIVLDSNTKNGYAPAADDVANMMLPYFFLIDAFRKGPDMTIPKNAVFHVGVLEDVFVQPAAVAISATPPPAPTPGPPAGGTMATSSSAPASGSPTASPDIPAGATAPVHATPHPAATPTPAASATPAALSSPK